jgi:hypothetical protein
MTSTFTTDFFFKVFLVLFAIFWLCTALRGVAKQRETGERFRWVGSVAGFLITLGALGFFGQAFLATGVVRPPNSLELPPGNVRGVVTSSEGNHIVPLVPSGRIQVYDPHWKFLTGWQVEAHGGDFTVESPQSGVVEVYTGRGSHHYTFTEKGQLISSTTHDQASHRNGSRAPYTVVPTPLLLWPFSSPFLSWGLVFAGLLLLRMTKRLATKKQSGLS